jgi:hypothetical protein
MKKLVIIKTNSIDNIVKVGKQKLKTRAKCINLI